MVFSIIKKYRDLIYLTIACIFIIFAINKYNKLSNKELEYKLNINTTNSRNKFLENEIKVLDDSIKKSSIDRGILEKKDKKITSNRDNKIKTFNEKVYKDTSVTNDSAHRIYTRFYQHEDSVYRGLIEGLKISRRKNS